MTAGAVVGAGRGDQGCCDPGHGRYGCVSPAAPGEQVGAVAAAAGTPACRFGTVVWQRGNYSPWVSSQPSHCEPYPDRDRSCQRCVPPVTYPGDRHMVDITVNGLLVRMAIQAVGRVGASAMASMTSCLALL